MEAQIEARASLAKRVNAALAGTGWAILEASLNTETGFARIIAERRDYEAKSGVMVTLHRSHYDGAVLEMRDSTKLVGGMYKDHWEVVEGGHFGRRRHMTFKTALRALAHYIDDNSMPGALEWQGRKALGLMAVEV
jgi:hypothetical protein